MTLIVTAGAPGAFEGGPVPSDMAELRAIGDLGQTGLPAWGEGQFVTLANGRKVHWAGDETGWKIGEAPAPRQDLTEENISKILGMDQGVDGEPAVIASGEIHPDGTVVVTEVFDKEEWERIQAVVRNAP